MKSNIKSAVVAGLSLLALAGVATAPGTASAATTPPNNACKPGALPDSGCFKISWTTPVLASEGYFVGDTLVNVDYKLTPTINFSATSSTGASCGGSSTNGSIIAQCPPGTYTLNFTVSGLGKFHKKDGSGSPDGAPITMSANFVPIGARPGSYTSSYITLKDGPNPVFGNSHHQQLSHNQLFMKCYPEILKEEERS